jgi:hypothetical protein
VLTFKCPFFEKCLDAVMQETRDNAVSLPEDDPQAFQIIVEWMYSDRLGSQIYDSTADTLILAYVLADKLCMPAFENQLIDYMRLSRSFRVIAYAGAVHWSSLPEKSPSRQFILDLLHYLLAERMCMAIENLEDADFSEDEIALKVETNPDLATALLLKAVEHGLRNGVGLPMAPWRLDGCKYHIHEDGKSCK